MISSQFQDNEFGPGIYTSNSLKYALDYAGVNGAIMVFRAPDLRDINIWEPSSHEWTQLVASWRGLPLPITREPLPDKYRKADVIRGPISSSQGRPGQ